MGIDPKDTDLLQLLKKLKDANGAYPQDLLVSRRQGYLKQVAEIGGAAGLSIALKNTARGGKAAGLSSSTSGTLLEGLLVIAIVAEASTVAYFYRDKISQFVRNLTNQPKVEEVSSPPVISSPVTELQLTTASPIPTGTLTETPIATPSLLAAQPTAGTQSGGITSGTTSGGGGSQAVATPKPSDNNGNQYGLTPKPDRTKDPTGNSTNSQDNPADSKKSK